MNEETSKAVAEQLRKPQGEYALEVGRKMNEGNHLINLYAMEALDLSVTDHVLEIGMGNGFFVKDIIKVSDKIKYTGCDYSESMVNDAIARNDEWVQSGQVEFYKTEADNLPFSESVFDKVFCVNTIYFWDNPIEVLTEIRRVLKPQGKIVIAIRPKKLMQHYPFAKHRFSLFTKDDLTKVVTEANFKVTDVIEREEPDQEISGGKLPMETLIVCGMKE